MEDLVTSEVPDEAPRNRGRKRWIFGAAALLLLILLCIGYWQRFRLANRVVADQLKKYGVPASYTIKEIGLRTQRLENVIIGDPKSPDLVAKLVEVDISVGFSGATIKVIRADGVHVHGGYDGDKLSFGALDKFRDLKSKKPFEFPDLAVELKNASLTFETPWGRVGAGFNGKGQLRNRFAGALALRAPTFGNGDCAALGAQFDGRYVFEMGQPNLVGPILAESVKCKAAGFTADKAKIAADVRLSKSFDRWFGNIQYAAHSIEAGANTLTLPKGNMDFDGGMARTNFSASLDTAGYRGSPLFIRQLALDAKGHVDTSAEGIAVSARGQARLVDGVLDNAALAGIDSLSSQTKNTPIGPLLAKLSPAARRAAAAFDGNVRYDGHVGAGGNTALLIDAVALSTKSGARLTQSGVANLGNKGNGWYLASPLQLAISGGDLPSAKLALRQGNGGAWSGMMELSPFVAQGASISVSQLDFAGRPGGAWTFNGAAKLSGPISGGMVIGLNLPINGSFAGGNLALLRACETIGFDSVKLSNLSLGRQSFRICPEAGRPIFSTGVAGTRLSTSISGFAFTGALGSSPIAVNSATLHFNLSDGFAAKDVKIALGRADAQTKFSLLALGGRFGGDGIAGTLSGGSGQIGNVPLTLDDAAGKWSYRNAVLALEGSTQVLDAEQVDRFQPMLVPDMLVNLEKGVITAIGSVHEPKTGVKVADVDIRHVLANTTGRALLSVDGLRFDDRLQPDMLTPLTLGVIANLKGTVSGDGHINWTEKGVTSGGTFNTSNLDLAAAFGPVEGLSSEITFTDLLGLETGPGQQAKLASVNPGIAALNGRVAYQLLPGKRVAIEGGHWPFAGGELVLEPTVLDFAVNSERRLTFKVVGVDAEKFLAQYDFQNLRVSGVFDGTLPMVFNADGGRIVGGELVSRSGGGELSYLGELSYKDMGVFANYAFQALKSIRYRDLTIGVDGDLGGEIITKVSFSGIQQGSLAKRNFITKQLARIPIKFNISITAEFLKLIGSIRSIYDPTYDNQSMLPDLISREAGTPPITGEKTQPPVSKAPPLPTKPKGE